MVTCLFALASVGLPPRSCQSPDVPSSPADFQTLASILCVEPKRLAIGRSLGGWTPPPAGWFTFGSHEHEHEHELELEFSDELHADDGLPRRHPSEGDRAAVRRQSSLVGHAGRRSESWQLDQVMPRRP